MTAACPKTSALSPESFGDDGDAAILRDIKALGVFLAENRVFYYDSLLKGNTLCRAREDNSYELVIVDGLGDTVFIPILNYIPACARSRSIRKWDRYLVNPVLEKFSWVKRADIAVD